MEFNEFVKSFQYFIKRSKKVLLQLHRNPDSDSLGSVLCIYDHLISINKEVTIISPSEIEFDLQTIFPDRWRIVKVVDYETFKFEDYDLFIINDTSDLTQLTAGKPYTYGRINEVLIDHHEDNSLEIQTKYIGEEVSNTELVYRIFKKIGLKITKEIATYILAGIYTDTANLTALEMNATVFKRVFELVSLGGDYKFVVKSATFSNKLSKLKLVGYGLESLVVVKGTYNYYSYIYIDNETYIKYGQPDGVKDLIANRFIESIIGTTFGIVFVKKAKGKTSFSIRSSNDFNCIPLAHKLGGGGHYHKAGGLTEMTKNEIESLLMEYKGE